MSWAYTHLNPFTRVCFCDYVSTVFTMKRNRLFGKHPCPPPPPHMVQWLAHVLTNTIIRFNSFMITASLFHFFYQQHLPCISMECDHIFFIRMKLKVSVSGATSLHPFYEAVSTILVVLAALLEGPKLSSAASRTPSGSVSRHRLLRRWAYCCII